ncbi:hypothetical protein D9611_005456 [Ephemerocybe angulata]|uniref:Uncharacterized protein n=1 Tax=Ephemerocybe angulata TaxID=980116 RepID=A0A8H5C2C6_9AGAR|nr:hypothetical protein D9611_005456 [Tulosesus angulatus]
MPQAYTMPVDVPNLDFISGRQRFDSYGSYGSSSYRRERTYSLPTRPLSPGQGESARERQRKVGDPDDDPLARMRSNLERTTFLLSKMRVTDLGPEPEEIRILPPKEISRHHSEPTTHSKSYSQSHSSQSVRPAPRFRAVATQMERVDSTSTNTSLATQFTLDVSTYSYSGAPSKDEDHGTEFHQIINHGRLYNPSRGNMINHGHTPRRTYEHTSSPLAKASKSGHHGKGREEEEDVGEAPTSPGLVEDQPWPHPAEDVRAHKQPTGEGLEVGASWEGEGGRGGCGGSTYVAWFGGGTVWVEGSEALEAPITLEGTFRPFPSPRACSPCSHSPENLVEVKAPPRSQSYTSPSHPVVLETHRGRCQTIEDS